MPHQSFVIGFLFDWCHQFTLIHLFLRLKWHRHHTAPSVFNRWQESPPPSTEPARTLLPNCSNSDSWVHNTLYQFLLDHLLCSFVNSRLYFSHLAAGTWCCSASIFSSCVVDLVAQFPWGLSLVLQPERFKMPQLLFSFLFFYQCVLWFTLV